MDSHSVSDRPGPDCRFCGAPLGRPFVDLGMSPLCESYVSPDDLDAAETFYPLRVYVCGRCWLVQLPAHVDGREIFGEEYAYFSSYSDSWVEHAREFAGMAIRRFGLDQGSQVVEVASNDGYLLQHFVSRGVPVLGIEPAENVAEVARERGIPTRVTYLDEAAAGRLAEEGVQADLLVANNVLAHVPDLNGFVAGLEALLAPRGVLTAEFHHLVQLVERTQFDTIYHEHYSYLSLLTTERILAEHGLELFDVERLSTHGGSLRVFVRRAGAVARDGRRSAQPGGRRGGGPAATARVEALREEERSAGVESMDFYDAFGDRVEGIKRELLEFLIAARRRGETVAGYGAPGKGNTLLNYCGIRTDLLDYTVDRSEYKQGRYTPGTHIPIHPPAKISETRPDWVLILPWNLEEEIVEQMSHVREWGGRFVVPIPDVRVVE